ncbi:Protein of unknown function, partial [Gryllus bimaculatus]
MDPRRAARGVAMERPLQPIVSANSDASSDSSEGEFTSVFKKLNLESLPELCGDAEASLRHKLQQQLQKLHHQQLQRQEQLQSLQQQHKQQQQLAMKQHQKQQLQALQQRTVATQEALTARVRDAVRSAEGDSQLDSSGREDDSIPSRTTAGTKMGALAGNGNGIAAKGDKRSATKDEHRKRSPSKKQRRHRLNNSSSQDATAVPASALGTPQVDWENPPEEVADAPRKAKGRRAMRDVLWATKAVPIAGKHSASRTAGYYEKKM